MMNTHLQRLLSLHGEQQQAIDSMVSNADAGNWPMVAYMLGKIDGISRDIQSATIAAVTILDVVNKT